jgi:class 3 adenylate cyclase
MSFYHVVLFQALIVSRWGLSFCFQVAVCGLPDPQRNHFVIMCRFAQDCLVAMRRLTAELEVELGPDTADLMLRVGLHSGPVVAGVLRGEKVRNNSLRNCFCITVGLLPLI